MLWFLLCVAILLSGYFIYGKIVEKIFVINPDRKTPAYSLRDGVDYVPMTKKKIWLIQLLNIAGTGPIFGPILGALYGPVAMLWIVFGCVFAGAVHDYFSGMLSIRNGGANVPYLAGKYLGRPAKHFMNIIAILLLLLVGVVFVASPASLLTNITSDLMNSGSVGAAAVNDEAGAAKGNILIMWTAVIFIYYIIATLVPIDKIIGRIYPFFGALLLFMTCGMLFGLFFEGIPFFRTLGGDISLADFFTNMHPKNAPIWPLLFITIACGAISGFHATQSPLMARCTENEREGRFIFYGAMIGEGIIALIWCMVGLSFYNDQAGLAEAIQIGTPSKVVYDAAIGMLGVFGGILAVLGVVVLPITSGDTAFRAARLLIADFFKYDQRNLVKRLTIALPLFAIGFWVSTIDFSILWRYFGWANQTTAMVMLWTAAAYLFRHQKFHWVCTIPAVFMTLVCSTFLLNAPIGFGLDYQLSVWLGGAVTAVVVIAFFMLLKPISADEQD
ncbi:carbon starvation CstA family protein [Basfia succiniciproducens]|uniref:Carbon starvation protein CstA n=1 Tax=Basfia succiniciproducens TaxID=653940 RepID=A0A1G5CGZ0_9PAST|nr:carbon starvation protein A [Basfia succiniciproducens]QIM68921.1 carbon starvation protein CstA [Basfia succiniciproducens]SCY01606.1 Carbon starvation protein CstA [Basfia succiniciproducens]